MRRISFLFLCGTWGVLLAATAALWVRSLSVTEGVTWRREANDRSGYRYTVWTADSGEGALGLSRAATRIKPNVEGQQVLVLRCGFRDPDFAWRRGYTVRESRFNRGALAWSGFKFDRDRDTRSEYGQTRVSQSWRLIVPSWFPTLLLLAPAGVLIRLLIRLPRRCVADQRAFEVVPSLR